MSEKTLYPPYDPNKQYKWEPEDKFEMDGKAFGLFLNTVRAILGTERAAHLRLILQCNDEIEKMMEEAVAKGVVVEAPQQQPQMQARQVPPMKPLK